MQLSLVTMADATSASNVMHSYVTPAVTTICAIASLACIFFLVNGGIQYATSSGRPERLEHAKKIIRNAVIGLILVLAAATLTAILAHAYSTSGPVQGDKLPELAQIQPQHTSSSLVDVLINAVVGMLKNIIQSIGEPFVQALSYFTNSTPLMGDNSSVFNLWRAIVGITDVLFVLVVALLGFHVMSFANFGLEEVELKHIAPQMALIFLLINTSIFTIDGIISLSNGMIRAIQSGFPSVSIWDTLADITKQSTSLGLAGLLIMIAFLVLSIMLLVYYVGRLITLYIGAILSPLVLLLWLLPAFKDFTITAAKTYLTTIFVLFVHVVILLLAASLFVGLAQGSSNGQPNTLMALIVGMATVLALLKTQGVMSELSYAASTPRAARELSGSFIRGVSYIKSTNRTMRNTAQSVKNTSVKASKLVQNRNNTRTSKIGDTSTKRSRTSESKPLKTGETRRAPRQGENK